MNKHLSDNGQKEVFSYMRKIRNRFKRSYAFSYYDAQVMTWEKNPTIPGELSYMTAQAVRMTINEIFEREGF